jgi:2-octaprenyl-6-methoxyphenol hydroxylase
VKDVAIVGAGPVGATLALALADAKLDLVVADSRQAGETLRADRTLALSHGARLILERLGVWSALVASEGAVTPIVTIDVSQAGGFGVVELTAAEQGLPALGYVVSYRALQAVLDAALARAGIDVRFGTSVRAVHGGRDAARVEIAQEGDDVVDTRLAVVADGAATSVPGLARKRHEYGQAAIVASVALAKPHRGIAYERFTREGPIALLPEGDHYALVWTRQPQLEIFADDVKCAHGATVGQLDSEAVFYLTSRGLSDASARDLLTYAFGAEVIDRIPVPSLKLWLEHAVLEQTARRS